MMKRKILALILTAIMIVATLTACRVQNNNNNPGGTEPNQTTPSTQTTPNTDNPFIPPVVTWQDVDKSVFSLGDVKLRQEAANNGVALATIPALTELHCTKQSTSWYYVEYESNGEVLQGYVSKTSVTEIDILGTGPNWVAVEGGSKIMYVKPTTLNVRLYPTDADFSEKKGSYSCNEEVTVLATNGTWARIQYSETEQYYVAFAYLSETPVEDPNNTDKYKDLFTDVEHTQMYVDYVSQVKLRKAPNTSSDELLALSKGDAVTVLKVGVVDGKEWKYVVVEIAPSKPGVGVTYVHGYISSDCLSYTNGEMTLDALLALYPNFTKIDETMMYVLLDSGITIRSTPVFPEEDEDNSLSSPWSTAESIKALKVLATGTVDGTQWYIVEYTKKEGETETIITGFVGGKALNYLTSDPNGKATVTLDDLMLKYPGQFEVLETPITVTAKDLVNCYGTPNHSGDVLKELTAGTQVTMVAKEKGSYVSWAVVQDAEGAYYFVSYSLLNQAQ